MPDAYDPRLTFQRKLTEILLGRLHVFRTSFWYFLGAALLEMLCISLMFPTHFGWWRLGRAVSFSPLEVATAFKAPLLRDCDSNAFAVLQQVAIKPAPIYFQSVAGSLQAGRFQRKSEVTQQLIGQSSLS